MSEQRANLEYYLDLGGKQYGSDPRVMDKPSFGRITDVLFTRWTPGSSILDMEEYIDALHSYFRPFILERQDGELLEGVRIIFEPLCDGFLQFFNYAINLLSNNLLSEDNIDKIAQWIDEIQGHGLLAKLLSLKSTTIEAFASNLFPHALRLNNESVTRILLDAGVSPNLRMGYGRENTLQYTI
jgi:hypothetical protein